MKLSESIPAAFELWWEKEGAQLYAEVISKLSIHRAAKSLALAAFEHGVFAASENPVETEIPPVESDSLVPAGEPNPGDELVPAGDNGSARVRCGTCQNCGLENAAGFENDPVECSGCKYVGRLANIFERPAV